MEKFHDFSMTFLNFHDFIFLPIFHDKIFSMTLGTLREVQESATQVVWPRKEVRPRLRRKSDSGDGTTREKKARKTEADMDGLCQPRHESHRNDERRGP